MRAMVAAVAMALAGLAHGPTALADPERAEALAHLQRGVAAYRATDYASALRSFAAARELAPDKPNPYRWLALTHVQLGDCPRAVANIERFLARVPPDDPRGAEMNRLRRLCLQTASLRVRSRPTGAELRVDGARIGHTPHTSLSMRPGEREVQVRKPGYRTHTETVALRAGERHELDLRLERTPRPVTQRWWFWTAVASSAIVVVGVVAVLSDDPDATMLPPVRCDDAGCR